METVESRPAFKAPLWTGTFIAVLVAMHLFFLGFFGTFTALPLYLEGEGASQIGFVVGVQALAAAAVRPVSGRLVDRYGRKRFQTWGAVLAGAGLAGHALTADPFLLVPFRLLHGVAMSLFTTASLTMGADAAPVSRRGEAMGYYTMVNNTAQLYGPWLGFFVATRFGFTYFFVVAGAASLLAAVVGLAARDDAPRTPVAAPPAPLISRTALVPTGVFVTMTIVYGAVQGFLALFAEEWDLGNPGAFFAVFGLTLVLLRVASGALSDRWGRAAIIVPGMLVTGAAMALLATTAPALFLASAALFGAGFAMGHTGLLALTVDRTGDEERGAAMATFVLAWDVGTVLGTVGMGLLAGVAGYPPVFGLAAFLPLLGLSAFLKVRPSSAPARG